MLRSFLEEQRGGPDFKTRELETECALRIAGCSGEQWTYSDVDPDWPKIEERVAAVADDYDILIAPAYEEGGHEHHNALARIAERIRPDRDGLVSYFTYVRGAGRTADGLEIVPSLFERELKRIALRCYQSQIDYEPTKAWFGEDQREYLAR